MNSKILFALFFVSFICMISAVEESQSPVKYIHMEQHSVVARESDASESSDVAQSRVRRQFGYGYPMMGYGMGMYRPWGMYRPYGMYGMYRPFGMWG